MKGWINSGRLYHNRDSQADSNYTEGGVQGEGRRLIQGG